MKPFSEGVRLCTRNSLPPKLAEIAPPVYAAWGELLADALLIPLYFYVSKHLVAPRVEGWYDNVMNVTYSKDLAVGISQEPKP